METAFYSSNPAMTTRQNDSVRKLKSSLTLDLATKEAPLAFDSILSSPDVRMLKLATPELDRLLLQHHMTNGGRGGGGGGGVGGCGGGGGGAVAGSQVWFPKTVTEEQEAYARGFVDALLELHNKREAAAATAAAAAAAVVESSSGYSSCLTPKGSAPEAEVVDAFPSYDSSLDLSRTRLDSDAAAAVPFSSAGSFSSVDGQAVQLPPEVGFPSAPLYDSVVREKQQQQQQRKNPSHSVSQAVHRSPCSGGIQWKTAHSKPDAILTTPVKHHQHHEHQHQHQQQFSHPSDLRCPPKTPTGWLHPSPPAAAVPPLLGCLSDTPPISPIDMVQQEAIKLARKRARNRLAATRCRNRKLERIANLQEKVDELKEENAQLTSTAVELRETIARMRREIDAHVMSGCRLNVTGDLRAF